MDHVQSRFSPSPNSGRSPASRKRRSMLKYEMCRKKRIKCTPASRVWPGQRCTSCEEHGLPCGPNVHSRHAATTKLANKPSLLWPLLPGCAEYQNNATVNILGWDALSEFDWTSNLADFDLDWNFSLEPSLYTFQDCSPNLPLLNVQERTEPCSEPKTDSSQHDEPLKENKSFLSGVVDAAIHDEHREIDQSFFHLGVCRIAFESVESTIRAVTPLTHECTQESVKHALKFISWCIASKHDTTLSAIVAIAGKMDQRLADGVFLRAFRALDDLDCIDSRVGPARESQIKLRTTIIAKLYTIYSARDDVPEAENWLRRLDVLSGDCKNETADQVARSLQRTSEMAQAVLDGLDLDQDIRSKLHFSKSVSFPSLHRAIRAGHVTAAQLLANTPSTLMDCDLLRRNAFHIAAELGQAQTLRPLSASDCIDQRDVFRRTPLVLAACNGHLESFAHLIEMGADMTAKGSDGRSILAVASSAGRLAIVQHLLQLGVNPNDNDLGVSSALYLAASGGHEPICKILFERRACPGYAANSNLPSLRTTIHNSMTEVQDMTLRAANDQTVRDKRVSSSSDKIINAPFNLPTSPRDFSVPSSESESVSVSSNSTVTDYDIGTCESVLSGIYGGPSCIEIDVPELSSCTEILLQPTVYWDMEGVKFQTM